MKPCRSCKNDRLMPVLSLGDQPHCNSFLLQEELDREEPRWPLDLYYCAQCHLVQLGVVVDRELMFRDYLYVSGTTRTLREHFQRTAQRLVEDLQLPNESLVVDIGSNDGTFLSYFQELGMNVLGVDPATNITRVARDRGIRTVDEFFGGEVASLIRRSSGPAQLITAAGVFFHIDDMHDVCRGIVDLLDDRGVLHVQAIDLEAMLANTSYDNIYHEHLSYYTLTSLVSLLERFELTVFDVEESPIHGGSLLVSASKSSAHAVRPSVEARLVREQQAGLDTLEPYVEFSMRIGHQREQLLRMLNDLKGARKRVAAYGAPAKGNTLLNYCEIGPETIEYAAEKSPHKIGLYTPGTHIPVIDEEEAMKCPPDCFLLLAWNFEEELLEKNRTYREGGGRFLIPFPSPRIV